MALELVTGYWGMEHVTAEQDADLTAGIVGSGNYVLPVGEKMRAEAVTSNKIRIFDGIFLAYGRQCILDSGEFEDVTIENGTSGLLRNDMIVVRYKKDEVTGYEKAEFAVLKGQSGAKAVDPVPNNQDIRNGAFESEIPMYRVCLNGLAIEKMEPLYTIPKSLSEIAAMVETVSRNALHTMIVSSSAFDLAAGVAKSIAIPYNCPATPKFVIVQADGGAPFELSVNAWTKTEATVGVLSATSLNARKIRAILFY